MWIAKSIFVGSLAALVLVAAPALAKNSDNLKTEDKQASASFIWMAVFLWRKLHRVAPTIANIILIFFMTMVLALYGRAADVVAIKQGI